MIARRRLEAAAKAGVRQFRLILSAPCPKLLRSKLASNCVVTGPTVGGTLYGSRGPIAQPSCVRRKPSGSPGKVESTRPVKWVRWASGEMSPTGPRPPPDPRPAARR